MPSLGSPICDFIAEAVQICKSTCVIVKGVQVYAFHPLLDTTLRGMYFEIETSTVVNMLSKGKGKNTKIDIHFDSNLTQDFTSTFEPFYSRPK